ncbi:MAG: hypothetical protein ABIX01_08000 [Chitinophagaceae bacterium]
MKIYFLAPDGIGVRNYLYSDIIKHLKGHKIGLIHSLPEDAVNEIKVVHPIDISVIRMPAQTESFIMKLCADISYRARVTRNGRLVKNRNLINTNLKHNAALKKSVVYNAYTQLIVWFSKIASYSLPFMNKLDEYYNKQGMKQPQFQQLRQEILLHSPDVILCTHQRAANAGIVMTIARQLNIKTIAVVYSWDNLPKSRITFLADKYFVWSDYMKKELNTYFPTIKDEAIHITGTPQFEIFRKKEFYWTRSQFLKHFNLPDNRKIICFSGGDLLSANDQYYLEDLADAVYSLPEQDRPFILVRPAPVDPSGRLARVCDKFPDLLRLGVPEWKKQTASNSFEAYYSTYKDLEVLTNVCLHCDTIVNIGSTMGLDFAHFNKPAIYLNYPIDPNPNPYYLIHEIYGLQHFRTLQDLDGIVWVYKKEDLANKIVEVLTKPNEVATERLKWKKLLTNDITDATKNIAAILSCE